MTTLAVHFIVHNDFSHLVAALTSLASTTHTAYNVYITVNSGDSDAIATIPRQFTQHIFINPTPQGFAANHNAFMARVDAEYYALLNDDVTLHQGTLDTLVGYLKEHPDVGLVAPRVLNPDGTPQLSVLSDMALLRALYTISGLSGLTKHGGIVRNMLQKLGIAQLIGTESLKGLETTRDVPVLVGVAMVVKRAAFAQVGGMDEPTLVYGEEYGWHLRLRRAGWRVVFVTDAAITHHNPKNDISGWRITEHRKSILAYFLKYKPRWQAALIRAGIITSHSFWAAGYALINRQRMRDHWRTVQMALRYRLSP